MTVCDLRHHPKACAATQRSYRRTACATCEDGRINAREAAAAAPPANKPIETEKEAPVPEKMDAEERVFKVIQKFGSCASTPILQRVTTVNAEQLRGIAQELAKKGRIEIRKEGRKTIYAIPGAAVAPSNDATAASKPTRRVNRASATPPIKTRAKTERPVPASRRPAGNGVYAAAIAELEARRTAALDQVEKIDRVIETLRALA